MCVYVCVIFISDLISNSLPLLTYQVNIIQDYMSPSYLSNWAS